MKFGTRAGDSTRKTSTGGSGGGNADWLRYFKDTETRMRFLDELDDWIEVWMHWSPSASRSYPCTEDFDTCPGHNSENERERSASKRYIVNALVDGYVNAWIIPGSLWDDMNRHADKAGGTILDRDFTVVKKNTDAGVRYAVDREERDRIDLSKYDDKKKNIGKMLEDVYVEVWGKLPAAGEENQDPPRREVVDKEIKAPTTAKEKLEADTAGDPPTEPAPQGDEEEQEISEDQLRAMSAPQIQALFRQCGLEVPESDDSAYLADELIKALA